MTYEFQWLCLYFIPHSLNQPKEKRKFIFYYSLSKGDGNKKYALHSVRIC